MTTYDTPVYMDYIIDGHLAYVTWYSYHVIMSSIYIIHGISWDYKQLTPTHPWIKIYQKVHAGLGFPNRTCFPIWWYSTMGIKREYVG